MVSRGSNTVRRSASTTPAKRWEITWITPVQRAVRRLSGGPWATGSSGGRRHGRRTRLRWSFNDITPSTFVWRGEVATDGDWRPREEMRLRRADPSPSARPAPSRYPSGSRTKQITGPRCDPGPVRAASPARCPLPPAPRASRRGPPRPSDVVVARAQVVRVDAVVVGQLEHRILARQVHEDVDRLVADRPYAGLLEAELLVEGHGAVDVADAVAGVEVAHGVHGRERLGLEVVVVARVSTQTWWRWRGEIGRSAGRACPRRC